MTYYVKFSTEVECPEGSVLIDKNKWSNWEFECDKIARYDVEAAYLGSNKETYIYYPKSFAIEGVAGTIKLMLIKNRGTQPVFAFFAHAGGSSDSICIREGGMLITSDVSAATTSKLKLAPVPSADSVSPDTDTLVPCTVVFFGDNP